ncbi:helix-turn-helix domain-containing protein [Candidatus Nitrososphaera sp. FF02]|uniref:helix-turn-helix domain-containing protein n=1 Tax=Candidatus Nitrososphaera sp. FF02 TaxID=3398226 RepID=UPI0039ECE084
MYCELCGKNAPERRMVIVDATVFNVCAACARHGKPYAPSQAPKKKVARPAPAQAKIGIADDLVLDPEFPRLIREARMKKGLTHEQLGMQMNEKANLLRRFETGALKPDELFAKKLERFLGVKLYVAAGKK